MGWTDLELAASTGDLSELNTLIARGADLGTVNEVREYELVIGPIELIQNGQTALHFAAVNGHPRTIQLLIERGVDLNAEDSVSLCQGGECRLDGYSASFLSVGVQPWSWLSNRDKRLPWKP